MYFSLVPSKYIIIAQTSKIWHRKSSATHWCWDVLRSIRPPTENNTTLFWIFWTSLCKTLHRFKSAPVTPQAKKHASYYWTILAHTDNHPQIHYVFQDLNSGSWGFPLPYSIFHIFLRCIYDNHSQIHNQTFRILSTHPHPPYQSPQNACTKSALFTAGSSKEKMSVPSVTACGHSGGCRANVTR